MLHSIISRTLFFSSCLASSISASNLNELTLEEKVGQLFVVCFQGENVNEDAKELVENLHVGGIIYYDWANGLHCPMQVHTLSSNLQKLSLNCKHQLPLLIATDQEGGIVARLTKGFTLFPGNKALAMTNNPALAEESAYIIGKELLDVGVNFNLAPVVDINSNPKNPVIGIRSFGDTKETVVSFAKKTLEGYKKVGILTSIKHFPGHGDVEVDSHIALPILHKSAKDIEELEMAPFRELSSDADTVMTAHIMVPSLDPAHCATLSKPILNILRNEIGFNGVIIADSLVMEGVLKNSASIEDAAIKALNAGCDLLLLGGRKLQGSSLNEVTSPKEIAKIILAVTKAVKDGLISQQRLDEAVSRILFLKRKIQPIPQTSEKKLSQALNKQDYQLLSKKIAYLAIKTIKNSSIPPLMTQKVSLITSSLLQGPINSSALLYLGKETSSLFFNGLTPTKEEIEQALALAKQSDTLIFCSYNAWKNPSQARLISLLAQQKKPFILIVARDSADETLCPTADLIIKTFSPSAFSLQEACKQLP